MMQRSEKKWKPDVDSAWQHFYVRACADSLVPAEEDWVFEEDETEPPKKILIQRRVFSSPIRWSVAAVLGVICIGLAALFWSRSYITDMIALKNINNDEVLVTVLPDGSTLFLSGGAEITYPRSFSTHQRRESLQGEAFFEVSHDQKRPFIVETEFVAVEVIGTSFRIISDQERPFELAVRTGVVRVGLKNEEHEVLVEAGEQVQLMANWLQKSYVDDIDILSQNAHTFFFKDETLGEIIQVVNNHTMEEVKLVLDNESLADRVITVSFDLQTENMSKIAMLICETLGLKLTIGENIIVISK